MLLHRDRLWRGGYASPLAAAAGLLAGPAAVALAASLAAIALGAQSDVEGPAVVSALALSMFKLGLVASGVLGFPGYLILSRLGRAGLLPALLAGAAPGLLLGLRVAAGPAASGAPLVAALLLGLGLLYAAMVWLVMRLVDGNLKLPPR